jgi:nucleoside-diphosphate-sugar epimerase
MYKKALVLGAGGFIGSHLVKKLKSEGYWVRGVDIKHPDFSESSADEFIIADLRDPLKTSLVMYSPNQLSEQDNINSFDEVYQLAADMGGAGYINTGDNDAEVVHNSMLINLNVLNEAYKKNIKKIFYASSACVYNEHNQLDPNNPICTENSAYPANPDSEYGWEKLFSERLYSTYNRNYGIDIRIARFHNVFGPEGTFDGGKEKAPAAICRKVAKISTDGEIEVWGDGLQTRSFLYIDEAIEGVRRLMNSNYKEPINIGSEEIISMNDLAKLVSKLANKNISIKNIPGPQGVRGRTSDNTLIKEKLGWVPSQSLHIGLTETYKWIVNQIKS